MVQWRVTYDLPLLQLLVLRFGLFQDADVVVSVFPEGEEIFVGGVGLSVVTLEYVSTSKLQMRHCTYGIGDHGNKPGRVVL